MPATSGAEDVGQWGGEGVGASMPAPRAHPMPTKSLGKGGAHVALFSERRKRRPSGAEPSVVKDLKGASFKKEWAGGGPTAAGWLPLPASRGKAALTGARACVPRAAPATPVVAANRVPRDEPCTSKICRGTPGAVFGGISNLGPLRAPSTCNTGQAGKAHAPVGGIRATNWSGPGGWGDMPLK